MNKKRNIINAQNRDIPSDMDMEGLIADRRLLTNIPSQFERVLARPRFSEASGV